jgi:hypothetical protein
MVPNAGLARREAALHQSATEVFLLVSLGFLKREESEEHESIPLVQCLTTKVHDKGLGKPSSLHTLREEVSQRGLA